jgi:hypothetical protein
MPWGELDPKVTGAKGWHLTAKDKVGVVIITDRRVEAVITETMTLTS